MFVSGLMIRAAATMSVLAVVAGAAPLNAARLGVLPFASISVEARDLSVIGEAIRRELTKGGAQAVDMVDIRRALESTGCQRAETWNRESCIRMVGRDLGVELVLGGTLNMLGSILDAHVELFEVESSTVVWSKDYQIQGTLEQFYQSVPSQIAADLPQDYQRPAPAPQPPAMAPPAADTTVDVPVAKDPTRTVASGLVLGVSATFAMGAPIESQSPYGFGMHAVYPTTDQSQLRLRLGLPLFENDKIVMADSSTLPDVLIAIEHEWGLPSFAVGFGAAYMYLNAFDRVDSTYDAPNYRVSAHYATAHTLNLSLNLRAGKPNQGFQARLSWPLPFLISYDTPNHLFFEYSAFGVFGGSRVKGGIGIRGAYKYRDADYVRVGDITFAFDEDPNDNYRHSGPYEEYDIHSTSQFYVMVPCARLAILWGQHLVTNLNFELGGTLLMRGTPEVNEDLWTPSIGFDIVYSFGKMETVALMDGTF